MKNLPTIKIKLTFEIKKGTINLNLFANTKDIVMMIVLTIGLSIDPQYIAQLLEIVSCFLQ